MRRFLILPILGLALAALAAPTTSGPYRGPMNNGIYTETGLAKTWPADGPPLLWKANIGEGYGGVTVVDDMVYVPGGINAFLYGFTLEGEEKVKIGFGNTSWKRFGGTKSTALIQGDIAVVTRPNADIIALDLKTGEQRWQLNAWTAFGNGSMGWGYPSTPSVFENKLILNPVSRADDVPPIVAVDVATGATVWKADAGTGKKYSCGDHSAAVFVHNGRPISLNPTWRYQLALDPRDGSTLWEIPDANVAGGSEKGLTPTYNDGYVVFDRSGWASCIKLSDDGLAYTPKWSRPFGGFSHAVILNGRVYLGGDITQPILTGATCLEVGKPASWTKPRLPKGAPALPGAPGGLLCLDAETGAVLDFIRMPGGVGHVIAADWMLYVVNMPRGPEGERNKAPEEAKLGLTVTLIEPTEAGMIVRGQFRQAMTIEDAKQVKELEYQANINPVVAKGRLFIRYGPLWVYDVRPAVAAAAAYAPAAPAPSGLWDLRLKDFAAPGADLWLTIQVQDGVPLVAAGFAPAWNKAIHTAELKDLKLADGQLTGTITVTLQPDATIPADKKPIPCTVTLTATGKDGLVTGTYAGGKGEGTAVSGRYW